MSPIERQASILLAVLAVSAGALAGAVVAAVLAQASALLALLASVSLAGLLAAALLGWQLRRGLGNALKQMHDAFGLAAEGDRSASLVTETFSTDIGEAFSAMQRRARESDLSRDYLESVLSGMNEAVFVADASNRIEFANDAASVLAGRPRNTLIGMRIADVLPVEPNDSTLPPIGASKATEARVQRADGSIVCASYTRSELRDHEGAVRSTIYAAQDIAERKETEQRMRYLARTDILTKIANRIEFQHRLEQSIARAQKNHAYLALLYLDVDRFKDINDTFGHTAGDQSLETFAQRISDALPEGSVPGRLAGDEFCVLLPPRPEIGALMRVVNDTAQTLLRIVARPFEVQGEEITISASAGATVYPRDADNVADLLRNADAAMYHAKRAGGNCYEIFEASMSSPAKERLKLKSKLSRAFERQELRLRYQPKYRLSDGRISGAEALVRWDLPDHGLVLPSHFIPLAEESNLIVQIGDWVLDRVCADYRAWQKIVPSPRRISVNLSLRQLQQQRFLESVRRTFRRHAISPTCLELEITETTLMEDKRATIRILDALYGMGLNLAIDDFGTGYSSLSALQQFPISTLKIDQSFVQELTIDEDNAAIVRTIIQMAHSLKLEVVAEGVETQEQLEFLRRYGCDYAQGLLFGDPMPASKFVTTLAEDAEGSGKYRALFA
jgi:diguanylate cyclase (GGDEF)-like protein/PAS domain S-box-containing protein